MLQSFAVSEVEGEVVNSCCLQERISQGVNAQAILGDLNTLGHGIARMSPHHCNDTLRWKTLGQYEAQFWMEN
eukprot:scaffold104234_cov48-Prasinocladus_malaysianus.AAC.1